MQAHGELRRRRLAHFSKPNIPNTVAECTQYERGGNDWIVTEVMSQGGGQDVERIQERALFGLPRG